MGVMVMESSEVDVAQGTGLRGNTMKSENYYSYLLYILPGHTQAYVMPSPTRVCCETTGVTQGLQLGNRDPSLEAVI